MRELTKPGLRKARIGRIVLAAALLSGATGAAQAQGNGFLELFGNIFGGGGNGGGGASQPLPQPDWVQPDAPPLVVRAHPRKHRNLEGRVGGKTRYNVADLKDVTIYTDKTLARGDAVMTPSGIKVFNGSTSWPYRDEDFVAIAESGKMAPAMRKELAAMDDASRPERQR